MNDFYIACLDTTSYEALKSYRNSFLWEDTKDINGDKNEYQDWSFSEKSGFRNVVKNKWKIIQMIYRLHPHLCWVDTDIIFKENPIEDIQGHSEILFQSDHPGSTLCSGFMVFNETKVSK